MKKIVNATTVVLLLALLLTLIPTAALAQEEVVCEQDATVQAEDSLSTLAEKFYGNIYYIEQRFSCFLIRCIHQYLVFQNF